MNNITFFMDELPNLVLPCNINDYNLNLILSFIHKTLFDLENGNYSSEIVNNLSTPNKMIFEFKRNPYGITANDMYQTIIYFLKTKNKYSSYFEFILGVKEYLQSTNANLKDIELKVYRNYLIANIYNESDYLSVFSSIQFAPLKFSGKIPKLQEGFGKFNVLKEDNRKIVLQSKKNFFKDMENLNVVFYEERNIEKQLECIHQGNLCYTGITSLTYKDIKNNLNIQKIDSNLSFRLSVNNRNFSYRMIKSIQSLMNKKIINDEELNLMISIPNFKNKFYDFNQSKWPVHEAKILYAGYYPNRILVQKLSEILESHGIKIELVEKDFKNFLKSNFLKYDFVLDIESPVTIGILDNLISELSFIREKYKDGYIDLLNDFIKDKRNKNYKDKINDYLIKYSTKLFLGTFNEYYIKSKKLPELKINELGMLKV